MLFGMKDDFEQRLAIVGSDYVGPASPIPLERLLRKHHRLLVDLRASGLTWEHISRLLAGNGVVHRNGLAFPPSHLRGVFGRHRKRLTGSPKAPPSTGIVGAAANRLGEGRYENRRMAAWSSKSNTTVKTIAAEGPTEPYNPQAATRGMSAGGSLERSGDDSTGAASARMRADRARVLAVMRQSALARRTSD